MSEFFENLVRNDFVDDACFLSETSGGIVGFSTATCAGLFPLSFPWTWEDQMVCREVPNIDPRYDLASHNESKRTGLSPPILSSSTLSCMIGKGSMASSQKGGGFNVVMQDPLQIDASTSSF